MRHRGDLAFGCVYLGQAAFSLRTSLSRYAFYGAKLVLRYELQLPGGSWEAVPLGVYTVAEADTEYNENFAVDGGQVQAGAVAAGTIHDSSTVAYTNEKGFAPATGVNSDTMPFVFGGLVVVAGAGALLISRKRRASEEF